MRFGKVLVCASKAAVASSIKCGQLKISVFPFYTIDGAVLSLVFGVSTKVAWKE